jgi:hypothetical protein
MTAEEGAPAEGYIARLRRRVGQEKLLTVGVRAIIRDDAGTILYLPGGRQLRRRLGAAIRRFA